MRKLLVILSFTLIIITYNKSFSQNWTPFNPAYTYHFNKSELFADMVSVKADSTDSLAGVQVCYLNRLVKPWPVAEFGHFHPKTPAFLKKSCLLISPDSCVFSDPGSYIFKPLSGKDSSWVFDAVQGITATVDTIYGDTLFSVADSLKRILLSTGDTILLSKDHGIILFQVADSGYSYKLLGIPQLNWGYDTPKFNDFCSFEVGDIFQYVSVHSTSNFHGGTSLTKWYQDKIISKSYGNGIYTYHVERFEKIRDYSEFIGWPGSPWITISYASSQPTYSINYQDYTWLDYNNSQLFPIAQNAYNIVYFKDDAVFQSFNKAMNSTTISSHFPDSIYYYHEYYWTSYEFATKLGLIKCKKRYNPSNNEQETLELKACIINSDTFGTLTSMSFYLDVPEVGELDPILVYPNPASDILSIDGLDKFIHHDIKITDIQGNIVFSHKIQEQSIKIDLSSFQIGMYFLRIDTDKNSLCKKFTVSR